MFITNEYTFKTHRQNIIDGWSRSQFITSKLIDVLLLVFIITLLYFSVVLVSGFANHTRLIRDTWGKVEYAGLFALQTFSQLSIAFLVGFLIRRAFLALGVFLFYFIVVENALVGIMKNYNIELRKYLPFEISDRIIPVPPFIGRFDSPEVYKKLLDDIFPHVIYTILLTSFIWFICYRINNRRDLK
jgi:ABC-type transport system involved in multi-copper enzyme maturation permease subunit